MTFWGSGGGTWEMYWNDRQVLGMDASLDAYGITHIAAYVAEGGGSSVSYFSVE